MSARFDTVFRKIDELHSRINRLGSEWDQKYVAGQGRLLVAVALVGVTVYFGVGDQINTRMDNEVRLLTSRMNALETEEKEHENLEGHVGVLSRLTATEKDVGRALEKVSALRELVDQKIQALKEVQEVKYEGIRRDLDRQEEKIKVLFRKDWEAAEKTWTRSS